MPIRLTPKCNYRDRDRDRDRDRYFLPPNGLGQTPGLGHGHGLGLDNCIWASTG